MKSTLASAVALIVTLGLAGTAVAQARHDEKPHGYDKAKAQAAASAPGEMPSSAGARHDEKPHNPATAKPATAKSTNAKAPSTEATPAVASGMAPDDSKK
jgi:hypothetical protein